jgi:antitoxin PrlF
MLSCKVTTKGQVTIPLAIRQKMHICAGDKVSFMIEDNHVVLTRKIKDIKAAFGLFKTAQTATLSEMKKAIRKGATDVFNRHPCADKNYC